MGKFKDFLKEDNNDTLQAIYDILDEMSEDEIDEFGYFLNSEFFDEDMDSDGNIIDPDDQEYTLDDIKSMIVDLGPEMYTDLLDMLQPEDINFNDEDDEDEEDEEDEMDGGEMGEGVSRRLKVSKMNKKSRKFMALTKAQFRQSRALRLRKNRQTKAARKRYYRINKRKIASYQKSRSDAIKKGKHIVKIRRS